MCMKQNAHHLRLTNKEFPENSHHSDLSECSEFSKNDIYFLSSNF